MFQHRLILQFKSIRSLVRFQHSVANVQSPLPGNLVLLGKAKERLAPPNESVDDISPPDDNVPVIRKCKEKFAANKQAVKVWVDSFANEDVVYDKAAELHPEIFAVHPRIDILHSVVTWQKVYREVDYSWARTRAEMGRGKKKPFAQKGTGRVRQGSTTPPFWKNGGIAHGPRGPKSLYYNKHPNELIKALTIALTIKRVQNDLVIVDDLKIPAVEDLEVEDRSQEQEEIVLAQKSKLDGVLKQRSMDKNSILFVYNDVAPENFGLALEKARGLNMMPMIGLNVLSILKHDKLVMHLDVLDELEEKLVWNMKKYPWLGMPHNFYKDMPINREKLNNQDI